MFERNGAAEQVDGCALAGRAAWGAGPTALCAHNEHHHSEHAKSLSEPRGGGGAVGGECGRNRATCDVHAAPLSSRTLSSRCVGGSVRRCAVPLFPSHSPTHARDVVRTANDGTQSWRNPRHSWRPSTHRSEPPIVVAWRSAEAVCMHTVCTALDVSLTPRAVSGRAS